MAKNEWRIWTYDVWGNADEGYTINARRSHGYLTLPENYTERDVLDAVIAAGILRPDTSLSLLKFEDNGDGFIGIDEERDGYPLVGLEQETSPNPLTRKETARVIKRAEFVTKRSGRDYASGYIAATTDTIYHSGPKSVPMNKVSYHLRRRLKNPAHEHSCATCAYSYQPDYLAKTFLCEKAAQVKSKYGVQYLKSWLSRFGFKNPCAFYSYAPSRQAHFGNPPHAEFRNVGEFKHYVEFDLLPQLDDAGMKLTAKHVWDLLALLKMRRFDADIVGYLKGQIKQYHAEGETEDVMIARILSTGIKFLYDETDGGKRVGHKNPFSRAQLRFPGHLGKQLFVTTDRRFVITANSQPGEKYYTSYDVWELKRSGTWDKINTMKIETLAEAHFFLGEYKKKYSIKNPLTSAERRDILKVADEHDRDALEHRSVELRKFDAGTAAGLREAAAIASARGHKTQDTGHRKNPGYKPPASWKWWTITLNGKHIDTVQYTGDNTAEDVKRSLVEHDGYDPEIKVTPKRWAHKNPAQPYWLHVIVTMDKVNYARLKDRLAAAGVAAGSQQEKGPGFFLTVDAYSYNSANIKDLLDKTLKLLAANRTMFDMAKAEVTRLEPAVNKEGVFNFVYYHNVLDSRDRKWSSPDIDRLK